MSSKKSQTDDLITANADLQRRIEQLETIVSAQINHSQIMLTELTTIKQQLVTQVAINESNSQYFSLLHKEVNYYKTQNDTLELDLQRSQLKHDVFEKDVTEWLYYLYRHQQKQFDYVNQTFLPPLARAFPDWIRSLLQKQQQQQPSTNTSQSSMNGGPGVEPLVVKKVGSISSSTDPPNPSIASSSSARQPTSKTSQRSSTMNPQSSTSPPQKDSTTISSTTTSRRRKGAVIQANNDDSSTHLDHIDPSSTNNPNTGPDETSPRQSSSTLHQDDGTIVGSTLMVDE